MTTVAEQRDLANEIADAISQPTELMDDVRSLYSLNTLDAIYSHLSFLTRMF